MAKKKVAIYLRKSRNEERISEDKLFSKHLSQLNTLVSKHGYSKEEVDIYREVESGLNTSREEINQLVGRIDEYESIFVMDIDRLSRSAEHLLALKRTFIANHVTIITPTEVMTFKAEAEQLMYGFKAIFADYEVNQIKKRMIRGKVESARKGKYVWANRIPLGYKKNEEKMLEIEEETAPIVRLIFQRTLEGVSAGKICNELNSLGYTTRKGHPFLGGNLVSIRTNPIYIGTLDVYCEALNEQVYIEDCYPSLISKEVFYEVQKISKKKSEYSASHFYRRSDKCHTMIQNLVYCERCHKKMWFKDRGPTRNIQMMKCECGNVGSVVPPLEKVVLREMKNLKERLKEELEALEVNNSRNMIMKLNDQLVQVDKNIDKLKNRKQKYILMYADGDIDKDEYQSMKKLIDDDFENATMMKHSIENRLKNSSLSDRKSEIEKTIQALENLGEFDKDRINEVLSSVIQKIYYWRDGKIHLKIQYYDKIS